MTAEELQKNFHILDNWIIEIEEDEKYKGQVSVSGVANIATIYAWQQGEKTPPDFLLHEFLHIALHALRRCDEKDLHEKEEMFVRNLCFVFLKFVEQEREECAKIADEYRLDYPAPEIAERIRARGK